MNLLSFFSFFFFLRILPRKVGYEGQDDIFVCLSSVSCDSINRHFKVSSIAVSFVQFTARGRATPGGRPTSQCQDLLRKARSAIVGGSC